MANMMQPLIPVGIDLGSLHARVAVGEHIDVKNVDVGKKASVCIPNIVSNAQGSRYTIALTAKDEQPVEDISKTQAKPSNVACSFIFGEAARRNLEREKKVIDEFLVRHLLSHLEIGKNNQDDNNFQACSSFFAHLCEEACNSSTHGLVQPSQLRIVLSMPPNAHEKLKENAIECLENGVRRLILEKEGKKKQKQAMQENNIVVGVISDAAAACLAYGHLDPKKNSNESSSYLSIHDKPKLHDNFCDMSNILVIDWGASGLSLTNVALTQSYRPLLESKKNVMISECAGEHIISALITHCASLLERKHSSMIARGSVLKNTRSVTKLRAACVSAVKTLARTNVAQIAVDGVFEGLDLNISLSKPRFDMLCGKVLRIAEQKIREFTNEIKENINVVLICGNVCLMPSAEALIRKCFTEESVVQTSKVEGVGPKMDIDEIVAIGCAMCARDFLMNEQQLENESLVAKADIFEEKKAMEVEVPISPVAIGIRSPGGKDIHTLICVGSPLPAHVSKIIKLDRSIESNMLVTQIDPSIPNIKVIAEINGISSQTDEVELTMELSAQGKISLAMNGGETIIL